ncbi:hypothetical protein LC1Nh_0047 [Candidatus Nanohalobium constans]|uniref:Uncharacterized protein n=1 Tax=Candidatus Nanohalobium constans TaxID=2565781 RepID=A0A5Q0UG70_9ARCH|nr:hypothetical protein LC1Nh_0047 [Candidatus Nanohalobium constans]
MNTKNGRKRTPLRSRVRSTALRTRTRSNTSSRRHRSRSSNSSLTKIEVLQD